MSPCPRAGAVTPGLKHCSVRSGRAAQGPSAIAGRRTGCWRRTLAGKASGRITKGSVDRRRASRCRGVGESGAGGQFLQVLAESGGGSDRGSPGRTGLDPFLTRDPSPLQPAPAAAKLLGHPHPLPPGGEGFLESPGFARPPARPRILCPAALERLLAPGARGQEGAPGRRRVVGKGGDDRHRQLE